jgi:phosphoserine aminotransferase
MAERNQRKAEALYDALDHSKSWRPHAKPGSRSLMNVTWRGPTKEREDELIASAEERGMSGLRGHRSVGGMRASLYNAFPEDGVQRLIELLRELDR